MSFRDAVRLTWPPLGVAAYGLALAIDIYTGMDMYALKAAGALVATIGFGEGVKRRILT